MKNSKINMHKNAIRRFNEILAILEKSLRELSYITEELERYKCMNDVRRKIFDRIVDTVYEARNRIADERFGHEVTLMKVDVEE